MRLLLLSNSTNAGEGYLAWPEPHIRAFLGEGSKRIFFVPFAGLRLSWDEYARRVRERFSAMGHTLQAAHETRTPLALAAAAEVLVVGGGNSFQLIKELHETGLAPLIRERVRSGVPYIGWSAGANVACPTIRTTNDMPVVEPPSLSAMGLVPFQINPHFTDAHPPGHAGETRTERLLEFLEANPTATVVGLPEGTALRREGERLSLIGSKPARLFRKGAEPRDLWPGENLGFLLGS